MCLSWYLFNIIEKQPTTSNWSTSENNCTLKWKLEGNCFFTIKYASEDTSLCQQFLFKISTNMTLLLKHQIVIYISYCPNKKKKMLLIAQMIGSRWSLKLHYYWNYKQSPYCHEIISLYLFKCFSLYMYVKVY